MEQKMFSSYQATKSFAKKSTSWLKNKGHNIKHTEMLDLVAALMGFSSRQAMEKSLNDDNTLTIVEKGLESYRVLTLSTGHLTEIDASLLESQKKVTNFPLICYEHEYGYIIYTGMTFDEWVNEHKPEVKKFGFSDSFIKIMEISIKGRYHRLEFDCDAIKSKELPLFDW